MKITLTKSGRWPEYHALPRADDETSAGVVLDIPADTVRRWHLARQAYDAVQREQDELYKGAQVGPNPYMHEDELPDLTDEEYKGWFIRSYIKDGVRIGPIVNNATGRAFLLAHHAEQEPPHA